MPALLPILPPVSVLLGLLAVGIAGRPRPTLRRASVRARPRLRTRGPERA